jgi:mannose/cellobiose epimerase-like protein (N-acyl-D-glucosamine 2-epimerase family)
MNLAALPLPDFTSAATLRAHVLDTLAFYRPVAFDPQGGFFHYFLDDGRVYQRSHRHLVSATRFVFNWVHAFLQTGDALYRDWAAHGLCHLDQVFATAEGDHVWTVDRGGVEDGRILAYGQAFVLLARAHAHRIGLCTAAQVAQVFDRMEQRFFLPEHAAYADERSAAGVLSPYRGQNANMHACEACLAAFEATGAQRYLARARLLAESFAFRLADHAGGQVWEHYHEDWSIDWDYNRDAPGDIFKPWGFQTGHQTEWAKLLMLLHAQTGEAALLERAIALQQRAWQAGWDARHGGLIYGYAPDGSPCDQDKYFWVQAESLAAAWRLWRATREQRFLDQYLALWRWSWQFLIDHRHGAWFRRVGPDGSKVEDTKSPAGKTDYHTMGACWDVLAAGGLAP